MHGVNIAAFTNVVDL